MQPMAKRRFQRETRVVSGCIKRECGVRAPIFKRERKSRPAVPFFSRVAGQLRAHGLRSSMLGAAKIYFLIFGVLTIAGGVIGYVKAGSTISLVAGAVCGILLIAAAVLLPAHLAGGLALAGAVSLLLAVQFVPKFIQTGKPMPAGMMSILSVIGAIFALVAWMKR